MCFSLFTGPFSGKAKAAGRAELWFKSMQTGVNTATDWLATSLVGGARSSGRSQDEVSDRCQSRKMP